MVRKETTNAPAEHDALDPEGVNRVIDAVGLVPAHDALAGLLPKDCIRSRASVNMEALRRRHKCRFCSHAVRLVKESTRDWQAEKDTRSTRRR